jgi:two-component system, chemotaxis family, CheB/CheR fusion protein
MIMMRRRRDQLELGRVAEVAQTGLRDDTDVLRSPGECPTPIEGLRLESISGTESMNDGLTNVESRPQDAIEGQLLTAHELQSILYRADIAMLVLDNNKRVRFFTPMTRAFLLISPRDIGQPLSELESHAAGADLVEGVQLALQSRLPTEHEIGVSRGSRYIRRILPYGLHANFAEGVVITFVDITDRRNVEDGLGVAAQKAAQANAAKSAFVMAARHDLRQPLQTITLLQGLLAENLENERSRRLLVRLDEALDAMSSVLNALQDVDEIEAGIMPSKMIDFPVKGLLDQLRKEFAYHARAKGFTLRVVPCSLSITSDPHLLEQMIRHLLLDVLKHAPEGKVLMGCRRDEGTLKIEIWNTGIRAPNTEFKAVGNQHHQLDSSACEGHLGSRPNLVHRLTELLGHKLCVRSRPRGGSIVSVEIKRPLSGTVATAGRRLPRLDNNRHEGRPHVGSVLIIENDPTARELLENFLKAEGHDTILTDDGNRAREMVAAGTARPDVILSNFDLPNGQNGMLVASQLREMLHQLIPTIILVSDKSSGKFDEVRLENCMQLNKPVKLRELTQAIHRLLLPSRVAVQTHIPSATPISGECGPPVVFVVEDDDSVRAAIRAVLMDDDRAVEAYDTCEAFLAAFQPGREGCLVIDAYLPGMNGRTLLRRLSDAGHYLPAVMITGNGNVEMAVEAMKAGALDIIEKPISRSKLLASIDRILERSEGAGTPPAWKGDAAHHVAALTRRQLQVMEMVLAGQPSKNIAADLGISRRTVEHHRASIMTKMGTKSVPGLLRLVFAPR